MIATVQFSPLAVAVRDAAYAAYAAGFAVIPPKEDGTKAPIGDWKDYQRVRPDESLVRAWYEGGRRSGLGLLTGSVSCQLESQDFDAVEVYSAYRELAVAAGLADLVERIEAGYLEETPNGMHWAYKCEVIAGNTKLARRPKRPEGMNGPNDKVKTLIETRGEGGFIIVAPSHGSVHPSGRPYRLLRGGFDSIVTITADERRALHELARTFDAMPKPQADPQPKSQKHSTGERPGDSYNAQTSWSELLAPHGWTWVYRRGEVDYWRRPGKDVGVSATTNYAGSGLLFVFSSSTSFEPETSYSPFGAYTILEHSGDYKAAARALAKGPASQPGDMPPTSYVSEGEPQVPKERIVSAPGKPLNIARELAAAIFTDGSDLLLRHHRGDFFRYSGGFWPDYEDLGLRGTIYGWLEIAKYWKPVKDGLELTSWDPTTRKVNDVVDALKATAYLAALVEPPAWIEEEPALRPRSPRTGPLFNPQNEFVVMANGLLHIPTRELMQHTPAFFSHTKLPYNFDAMAATPARWVRFLSELWPEDHQAIGTLQEMFGYVLAGGTSLQKIFLLVGPKRSGKGTIGRVLTGLLGKTNVAAPTLAGLGTNFGLQELITRLLALISDARLSAKADSSIVVERLLSISGEDSITVDRKYRDPWTGRIPARFVIFSNELPRLADPSGAMVSRIVLLILTKSFYGHEDPQLTDALLSEAPAIFNWALDGLDRLARRGYFLVPASSEEALSQLEDLGSPVGAFLRSHCQYGADEEVPVDDLWLAWKGWCEDQNRHPGTKASFGKDFRAFSPSTLRARVGGETRTYVYRGISLRTENNGQTLGLLGRERAEVPSDVNLGVITASQVSTESAEPRACPVCRGALGPGFVCHPLCVPEWERLKRDGEAQR